MKIVIALFFLSVCVFQSNKIFAEDGKLLAGTAKVNITP
ncbi:MAG: hypothetical protein JWQ09_4264, partial [Segetibacter sp.]|nr:hypothetical protein [Segetibacter sp.]